MPRTRARVVAGKLYAKALQQNLEVSDDQLTR